MLSFYWLTVNNPMKFEDDCKVVGYITFEVSCRIFDLLLIEPLSVACWRAISEDVAIVIN
jgi:hypothetical protein